VLIDDPDHCHFCTQEIQTTALAAIAVYREYFEDDEAALQEAILGLKKELQTLKASISAQSKSCLKVQAKYNELKVYFPDLATDTLDPVDDSFDLLNDEYDLINGLLDQKSQDLSVTQSVDWVSRLAGVETALQMAIRSNNGKISVLLGKLAKAGKQKQDIQRAACLSMKEEFRAKMGTALEGLKLLEETGKSLSEEVTQLKKDSGDKVSARDKVAGTFEYLLEFVFGTKYTFDAARFVVQRNKLDMTRGGDRTLSEGEKAVLGFCYYLAQTHLKVAEADDYSKVFFIIDDPVSSVSFDYIYSIAQIIKSLRLKDAELRFDSSPVQRPRMLILTHNDYFYNLASSNNIVPKSALFQLTDNNGHHTLNQQKQFVAPHVAHMKEVLDVASASKKSNHQTANSIRCVLEGMWRFCKPDLDDLGAFVSFASSNLGIEVKSMLLLNNLSHGAKMYSDATFETDIVVAAKEVVQIVERLAPGQLKKVA
jgi:wobble nucleotide-excising tRNase